MLYWASIFGDEAPTLQWDLIMPSGVILGCVNIIREVKYEFNDKLS